MKKISLKNHRIEAKKKEIDRWREKGNERMKEEEPERNGRIATRLKSSTDL